MVGAVDGDADDARDSARGEDRAAEPAALLLLGARPADEGMRVLRRLFVRPGDPARQTLAVAFDQCVQLGRVGVLQRAQPVAGGQLARERLLSVCALTA